MTKLYFYQQTCTNCYLTLRSFVEDHLIVEREATSWCPKCQKSTLHRIVLSQIRKAADV